MISIDLNLVWTIINLVVLYLLLKHFLIGPVMNVMDQRKQMIEDGFKNAQAAQDDADRLKQEYEAALSGAKQESVQLIEDGMPEKMPKQNTTGSLQKQGRRRTRCLNLRKKMCAPSASRR